MSNLEKKLKDLDRKMFASEAEEELDALLGLLKQIRVQRLLPIVDYDRCHFLLNHLKKMREGLK